VASRIEYVFTASPLASTLLYYRYARRYFPGEYARLLKLRAAPFVKLLLANEFPRTLVTTHLSASSAVHYGPFRTRAGAERFEQEMLDLFQVRRCQEDLSPSPEHPGCIYGEMGRCLRPCQQVVSIEEYRSETARLVAFLETNGAHLLDSVAAARDRCSAGMDFEEAARQHQRHQKIEQILRLRDDLVAPLPALSGVAVLPSLTAGCVELLFFERGAWHEPVEFSVASTGEMVPLDPRLRELVSSLPELKTSMKDRQEHIAILCRWFYSSWRDGEWLAFDSREHVPYRKLVRALSRAYAAPSTPP
jgi:excinuclease UvrABC nuclease subunit